MSSLRLIDCCFAYADVSILDGLTAHFTSGWTGIVGSNGG